MKVRSQLLVAFLLLAVVPLAGIVLYSYLTSYRAFRNAIESETRVLADEMRERMSDLRRDLGRRVDRLRRLPLGALRRPGGANAARVYSDLMAFLGDKATLVESFELIPASAGGGARRQPELEGEPFYVYPSTTLVEAIERIEDLREFDLGRSEISEEYLASMIGQAIRERGDLTAAELQALEATHAETRLLLGREIGGAVRRGDVVLGHLRALVPASRILRQVISGTRRAEGEVPYALDSQGNLYVADPEDEAKLAALGIPAGSETSAIVPDQKLDEWIVAETADPESGLTFGIARPTAESLREIRATAAQNFAYGLGMVAIALVGILWLSARMTRNLTLLTSGAEQLARGDLGVRVPVRSRDEFGRLARSLNRMAAELKEKQQRLVAEERRRRDQEVRRRLLEAENKRKSRELEEARQLQLSLLPKSLPEHPAIEVAVYMKTATEVGGDYYDFFPSADALTTAIGDAAGHGARAGTMVTVVKGLFSVGAAESELPLVLEEATRAIKRMNLGRMNMAASLARIRDHKITISAAGMPPVLLFRHQDRVVEEVALAGVPLGSLADVSYQQWESELAIGDTVLLMTDGFPELLNHEEEPMGYPRVLSLFEAAAAKPAEEIIADLAMAAEDWRGNERPHDDITFVVLKMREVA